jgi:hypothetical protein
MISFRLCSIGILVCATALACGDDDPTPQNPNPPPNPPPPPPLTFCDGFKSACEKQIECGVVVVNHASTVESCLAQTGCASVSTSTLTALGVELDMTKIDACATKLDELSCGQVANFRSGTPQGFESCAIFTSGTKAEGEACSSIVLESCEAGLTCSFANQQCPGTCEPIRESCRQDSCTSDQYCSYATGECVARGGDGAACEPNEIGDLLRRSCQDDFHCVAEMEQTPRCTRRIAAGESCDPSVDVELCVQGYFCDFTQPQPVCAARAIEDETCGFTSQCREDLYCNFDSNTCRPQGQFGDPCTDDAGSCGLGLACDETCKRPEDIRRALETLTIAGANEVCGNLIVCGLGLACTLDQEQNAFCTPALAAGTACDATIDPFACADALCDFATNICPEPLTVGETCTADGVYTGCPFATCLDGRCAALGELVCQTISD